MTTASRVLKALPSHAMDSTGLTITPQEREFVDEFFAGENAGNRVRSYLAVHPDAKYETASVEAHSILKQPNIQKYLAELHEQATALTAGKMVAWTDLLPLAQSVIVATAQGRLRNRLAYEAAVYLTARVMGSPVANHEVVVKDADRITRAVGAFAKRMQDERRQVSREVFAP